MTLSTRIASAEVGSRELDAEIWAFFHPENIKVTGCFQAYGCDSTQVEFVLPPKRTRMTTDRRGRYTHPDPYTTSLDAALALAERVLNLHCAVVESSPQSDHPSGNKACASVHLMGGGGSGRIAAPTPALALCAAILKAVESEK